MFKNQQRIHLLHHREAWGYKGLNCSNLTLLSPLTSFLKVFKPTQITWLDFFDTIAPFDKTKDKNTTHWFPPITTSKILTKNYTYPFSDRPCKLNWLLQSFGVPKIKVFAFEKQNNKTQIQTKHKHKFLRRVINHFWNLQNFS